MHLALPPPPDQPKEAAGLDADAIARLFAGFSRRLVRIVRGAVRCPDGLVEDACQSAWSGLLHHRARVSEDAVTAWLTRTAIREALRLSHLCAREPSLEDAVEVGLEPAASAPEPWELLAQREQLAGLRALAPRAQRVVWLQALGFSYDEMAERESCSWRTVDRQLTHARERLREQSVAV